MTSQTQPQTHAAYFDTSRFGYRFLNETKVRTIAGRYDLNPNEQIVRANADQAENAHGKPGGANGQPKVHWATDSRGYYDAEKLLDGLLDQETQDARIDARAHREFCRDAYGS